MRRTAAKGCFQPEALHVAWQPESRGREVRAGEKGRPLRRYGLCCKIKRRPAHKVIIIVLTAAFFIGSFMPASRFARSRKRGPFYGTPSPAQPAAWAGAVKAFSSRRPRRTELSFSCSICPAACKRAFRVRMAAFFYRRLAAFRFV